jgi:lipopolysaccharide export system protein LptA
MNKFNVFVVLSIVAAAALFGAMVTPALAQDNMSMTADNASMPMDMGNMTMTGNSTDMGNMTMTAN